MCCGAVDRTDEGEAMNYRETILRHRKRELAVVFTLYSICVSVTTTLIDSSHWYGGVIGILFCGALLTAILRMVDRLES